MLQKSSKPNFEPPLYKNSAKLHGVREQDRKIWLNWEDFQNLVKNCV